MKTLVAYYSQSGQTKRMAEMIAGKLGADLYEIAPVRKYNDDMWKAWDEAQAERKNDKYPALKGELPDISGYDTILLGTGIWGYTDEWLHAIVNYDILPMLSEYWFDDAGKLQRWENILRGVFQ